MEVAWDGPDPKDGACPYSVNFECKPAPAESLNSLESGRVILTVNMQGDVLSVEAKMTNRDKIKNLDKVQGGSRLKHQTVLSTRLTRGQSTRWTGEMSIPASWMEGGTKAYEKTGSSTPNDEGNPFTLEITYGLENRNCTARFYSHDAFHWEARPAAKM
jgi:hypothetical protein